MSISTVLYLYLQHRSRSVTPEHLSGWLETPLCSMALLPLSFSVPLGIYFGIVGVVEPWQQQDLDGLTRDQRDELKAECFRLIKEFLSESYGIGVLITYWFWNSEYHLKILKFVGEMMSISIPSQITREDGGHLLLFG